jgi:hypothetical protein
VLGFPRPHNGWQRPLADSQDENSVMPKRGLPWATPDEGGAAGQLIDGLSNNSTNGPSSWQEPCRTWGVESESRPQRGQFLPNLQAHSPGMDQKGGEKWTAAVHLQPTPPKSD